jgi:hypothetical protein
MAAEEAVVGWLIAVRRVEQSREGQETKQRRVLGKDR